MTITKCQEVIFIFKNRAPSGSANLCGTKIAEFRKNSQPYISQRKLADMLQLEGIDLDKNAIQRIESGKRFVTDIELLAFAKIMKTSADFLLK